MPRVPSATIVGLGLIGGSIGKALLRAGWEVDFIDPAVSLSEATEAAAAQRKLATIGEVKPESLVVIAMSVDTSIQMLEQIPAVPNTLTTVCSVMQPFHEIGARRGIPLVAGHPLAGSEKRGLVAADAELFAGKRWFVDGTVPHESVDAMIETTGAEIVWVEPGDHDRVLAITSHLPQLLSTALAATIAESGVELDLFGGSGLRSFLRLAGSDRAIWHSVFEANGENLERSIDNLLAVVRRLLDGDDEELFSAAQGIYAALNPETKND